MICKWEIHPDYIYLWALYVFQNHRAYSFCGTIEYMAPEVVEGGSLGHDFVSIKAYMIMGEDHNFRSYDCPVI